MKMADVKQVPHIPQIHVSSCHIEQRTETHLNLIFQVTICNALKAFSFIEHLISVLKGLSSVNTKCSYPQPL